MSYREGRASEQRQSESGAWELFMKLIRSQFRRSLSLLFFSPSLRFEPSQANGRKRRKEGCREGGAERRNGRNYGGSKRWKRKRARERRIHRTAITKCLAQRERERELSCIDMRSRVFLVFSNYTMSTYLRPPFSIRWWRWVRGPSGSSRPE